MDAAAIGLPTDRATVPQDAKPQRCSVALICARFDPSGVVLKRPESQRTGKCCCCRNGHGLTGAGHMEGPS